MPAFLITSLLVLAGPPKPQTVAWKPVLAPAIVVKLDKAPPEVAEAPEPETPEVAPARAQPEPPLRKARILRPRAKH